MKHRNKGRRERVVVSATIVLLVQLGTVVVSLEWEQGRQVFLGQVGVLEAGTRRSAAHCGFLLVALELLGVLQAYDPLSPGHGSFALSEDRAHEQHLDLRSDALGEQWHEGVQQRCSALIGRVCIIASPVRLTMSIPYLLVTPNG